jgi:hypothetical protein
MNEQNTKYFFNVINIFGGKKKIITFGNVFFIHVAKYGHVYYYTCPS